MTKSSAGGTKAATNAKIVAEVTKNLKAVSFDLSLHDDWME